MKRQTTFHHLSSLFWWHQNEVFYKCFFFFFAHVLTCRAVLFKLSLELLVITSVPVKLRDFDLPTLPSPPQLQIQENQYWDHKHALLIGSRVMGTLLLGNTLWVALLLSFLFYLQWIHLCYCGIRKHHFLENIGCKAWQDRGKPDSIVLFTGLKNPAVSSYRRAKKWKTFKFYLKVHLSSYT